MSLDRYARYEDILFEQRDHGVLLLTLNRPARYNATDAKLHKALSEV